MPSNTIPREDFLNRESEFNYLRELPKLKLSALGGNLFLEGTGGIGKTELLKQLYQSFFHENDIIPFYYSFRTANLKGPYFAKDYFTRFVKQYLSFVRKTLPATTSLAEPLQHLLPAISSLGLHWLSACIENFQEHVSRNDIYWQMVAAISAPVVVAQNSGKSVVVLLDDFDAAAYLHEFTRGDTQDLASLFGESMGNVHCPHVIAGSAGVLESFFTDHALIGMTERMRLGPLPADLAVNLFRSHLAKLKINCPPAEQLKFLNILQGNPLYIRNLAKTVWKMGKKDFEESDLRECYSFEVANGETAFYWSSLLNRFAKNNSAQRRTILNILMHFFEKGSIDDYNRLSKTLGLCEAETVNALHAIHASGLIREEDAVIQDFIRCQYMIEIEGRDTDYARGKITARHAPASNEPCFEMTIPMSENAELVVAKAVEQIGKNLYLNADFLNLLQLALIEVCINAIEHSGSYEKKVFLKFIPRPDRLKIIIENDGKPFSLASLSEIPVEEKLRTGVKRGWGLKLVHKIMDNVQVERINNRTRVTLTKEIDAGIAEPEIWTESETIDEVIK